MNFSPSESERKKIENVASEIMSKIKIKDASSILGGSGAKDTWLPGNTDIDIFVKFNYSKYQKKSSKLSDLLHAALKRKFKSVTRLHGSRDYFHVSYKGYDIEIIPILDISSFSQAKNITDVSPLHVSWVRENINGLADDIRKIKQFCVANSIYGAESYISGFSGYVLEIIIIYHGSFDKLIAAASKWKAKEVIDISNYHKDAFSALNIAKLQSPLIVIDPVQPDRNAAAALSEEKYNKFRELCRQYLQHPSEGFFIYKPITRQLLAKKHKSKQLIMLKASLLKAKPDVAGAKCLKLYETIRHELIRNEFQLIDSGIQFDSSSVNKHAIIYFILERKQLPKLKKHYGPPIDNENHLAAFKKKWRSYKLKQEANKVYVVIPRKYTKPIGLIKSILRNKELKQLVAGISLK